VSSLDDYESLEKKRNKDGRSAMQEENAKQARQWEARREAGQLETRAAPQGHYAQITESTSHHHDKKVESTIEVHKRYEKEARGRMQEELAKGRLEYEHRIDVEGRGGTRTDELGHFASGTKASARKGDPHEEGWQRGGYAERGALAEESAKQRNEWQTRRDAGQLGTQADDLGHFAQTTAATQHHRDPHGAGWVKNGYGDRRALADASAQQSDAWRARRSAGHLTSTPADLGHFGAATEAAKHRGDSSNAFLARRGMASEAVKESGAWEKRKEKGSLTTRAQAPVHAGSTTTGAAARTRQGRVERQRKQRGADPGTASRNEWAARQEKARAEIKARSQCNSATAPGAEMRSRSGAASGVHGGSASGSSKATSDLPSSQSSAVTSDAAEDLLAQGILRPATAPLANHDMNENKLDFTIKKGHDQQVLKETVEAANAVEKGAVQVGNESSCGKKKGSRI
jgi:hypothetical protein